MSRVVLATHVDPTVAVYVRDEEGHEIEQVGQFLVRGRPTHIDLVEFLSDADRRLGWSANGAIPDHGELVHSLPAVETDPSPVSAAALPERDGTSEPRRRGRPRGTRLSSPAIAKRYEMLLGALADGPKRFGELHGLFDRNAISSGQVWSMLDTLRKHGKVRRVGEGLYVANGDTVVEVEVEPTPRPAPPRRVRATKAESEARVQRLREALIERGELTVPDAFKVLGLTESARSYLKRTFDGFVREGLAIRVEGDLHEPIGSPTRSTRYVWTNVRHPAGSHLIEDHPRASYA